MNKFFEFREKALDIDASVWINACAGGGKTTLIIERVNKLIKKGADPRKILVLTFGKDAANEISKRLMSRTSDDLGGKITVATLHSYCYSLILKYSLEFGLGYFPQVKGAINDRLRILNLAKKYLRANKTQANLKSLMKELEKHQELSEDFKEEERSIFTCAQLIEKFVEKIEDLLFELEEIEILLSSGTHKLLVKEAILLLEKIKKNFSISNSIWQTAKIKQMLAKIFDIFLTKKGTKRKNLTNKNLHPRVCLGFSKIADDLEEFKIILEAAKIQEIRQDTNKAANEVRNLAKNISRDKELTFNDLISKTLFTLKYSQYTAWLQFKINQNLDHLIIDEAQDLSSEQWEIIKILAGDFFTGQGIERTTLPTIFVVGDVKQSIYGFRGAKSELFLENSSYFEEKCLASGRSFHSIAWNFTFRLPIEIAKHVDQYLKNSKDKESKNEYDFEHESMSSTRGRVEIFEIGGSKLEAAEKILQKIQEFDKLDEKNDLIVLFRSRSAVMHYLVKQLKIAEIQFESDISQDQGDSFLEKFCVMSRFLKEKRDDINFMSLLDIIFGESEIEKEKLSNILAEKKRELDLSLYKTFTSSCAEFEYLAVKIEKVAKIFDTGKISLFILELFAQFGEKKDFDDFIFLQDSFEGLEKKSYIWEFLELWRSGGLKRSSIKTTSKNVKVMTIHAAKGLEAKNVIVYEEFLPHRSTKKDVKAVDESQNLAYVALTRAKERLVIFKSKSTQLEE